MIAIVLPQGRSDVRDAHEGADLVIQYDGCNPTPLDDWRSPITHNERAWCVALPHCRGGPAATGGNSSQISACNGSEDALNGLLHQFLSEQQGTLAPRAEDGQGASTDLSRASSRCALSHAQARRGRAHFSSRETDWETD